MFDPPASVLDYRALAKARLPRFIFEYYDGGSYDELSMGANRAALQSIHLHQRILSGVDNPDLTTQFFGKTARIPAVLSPIGIAGLAARRGEAQAMRAADEFGVPFCLSTVSACSIAEVKAAAKDDFWFQLYLTKDRGFMREMLAEAKESGCKKLVFTVDMPTPGARYRDVRSGLAGKPSLLNELRRLGQAMLRPAWAWDVGVMGRPHSLGNVAPFLARNGNKKANLQAFFGWMGQNFDASVTFKDLEIIRELWDGELIVKGILHPQDARQAVQSGVNAIVVSNHGGRQLDGALPPAVALPEIAEIVDKKAIIFADGGIYSGLDILRLLALGADGVFLGRAWAFALSARGQKGVAHVLQLLESELRVAMILTGTKAISDIGPQLLAGPRF